MDRQHSNLLLYYQANLLYFEVKIKVLIQILLNILKKTHICNFVFTITLLFSQEPFVNHLESRWTPVIKVVKKPAPPEDFWWVPVVVLREPDTDVPLTNFSTRPQVWMKPEQHELTLEGFNDDHKWVVLNPGTIGELKTTSLV